MFSPNQVYLLVLPVSLCLRQWSFNVNLAAVLLIFKGVNVILYYGFQPVYGDDDLISKCVLGLKCGRTQIQREAAEA